MLARARHVFQHVADAAREVGAERHQRRSVYSIHRFPLQEPRTRARSISRVHDNA
jgi:hypothetical protein